MVCSKCGAAKTARPNGRLACKPCDNARERKWRTRNLSKRRAQNAANAKKRRADPETNARIREIAKMARANGGSERERVSRQRRKRVDFFGYHTQFARRYNKSLTRADLVLLWESQDGLCGLTGRRLAATAGESHLDHIVPRSRGGSDDLENLRWVCAEANQAKRNLTDDEFVALCSSVSEWIGRRIVAADGVSV